MPNEEIDFSMPGPQFNLSSSDSWLKKNWRPLAAVAIVALLVGGAVYFYKNYQSRISLLKPALENINTANNPSAVSVNKNQIKGSSLPEVNRKGSDIVVTAAPGNGATHLARQALKEYLKDKPELAQKLVAEQRIYIEDYLQKHLTDRPKTLHVGDQLTFPDGEIEKAIDLALALNNSQLQNLTKYVPLVPSLMTP